MQVFNASLCFRQLKGKMDVNLEHRYVIKFCFRLEKTGSKTFQILQQPFGEITMPSATVFRWHKQMSEGREVSDKMPPKRRRTTSVVEVVMNTVSTIIQKNVEYRRQLQEILQMSYLEHDYSAIRRSYEGSSKCVPQGKPFFPSENCSCNHQAKL